MTGTSRKWNPPVQLPDIPLIPLQHLEDRESTVRQKRQTDKHSALPTAYCDGVDEIGCYQVF